MPNQYKINRPEVIWENAEIPWDCATCECRYVMGDRITLKQLGELSGRKHKSLKNWSARLGWISKRRQYQDELAVATQKEIIAQESKRLAQEYASRNQSHLNSYELVRRLSAQFFSFAAKENRVKNPKFDAVQFQRMVSSLETAINGERRATGMVYWQDFNHAIREVVKEHYEVVDPIVEEHSFSSDNLQEEE